MTNITGCVISKHINLLKLINKINLKSVIRFLIAKVLYKSFDMSLNSFTCPLDPETNTSIKIYLFKNVKNVETIRNNVIKGVWKCAVIKPSLIVDIFQILVAANRSVLSDKSNSMVTRTVYSEILYNLSITKNITQSLSKFGIEKDSSMLVCFLVNDIDESEIIIEEIQGEACPISYLSNLTNMKEVKNAYKLSNLKSEPDFLDVIVSRMITKNFISY